MIKKMIALGSLLILCACTPGVDVFSDPSVPIEVQTGDRFTIELVSNITTGYSWVFRTPVDESVLRLVNSDYIAPDSGLTGAGGSQVWAFEALQPGTTMIALDYERSWEIEPPVQTAEFTIHVK
jgi:inhibitor of cysteine peptidase